LPAPFIHRHALRLGQWRGGGHVFSSFDFVDHFPDHRLESDHFQPLFEAPPEFGRDFGQKFEEAAGVCAGRPNICQELVAGAASVGVDLVPDRKWGAAAQGGCGRVGHVGSSHASERRPSRDDTVQVSVVLVDLQDAGLSQRPHAEGTLGADLDLFFTFNPFYFFVCSLLSQTYIHIYILIIIF
jgi:hypothetical protein